LLLIEANDEWLVDVGAPPDLTGRVVGKDPDGRSYISQGSMATLYDNRSDGSLSFGSEEEVAELAAA
jgi:hypothetical protein